MIDSLSWLIQSEQGSLPVCVFSMLVILDDEELPLHGGQDQGDMSALHILAQAAEASNAAEEPDDQARRTSRATANNNSAHGPAFSAEIDTNPMFVPASTRGRAGQRGGVSGNEAAVESEPGNGEAPKGSAVGAKGGARRAPALITADGTKGLEKRQQSGKRTLDFEQVKNSPRKAPRTSPAPPKACPHLPSMLWPSSLCLQRSASINVLLHLCADTKDGGGKNACGRRTGYSVQAIITHSSAQSKICQCHFCCPGDVQVSGTWWDPCTYPCTLGAECKQLARSSFR
jgi:hypothetical protein